MDDPTLLHTYVRERSEPAFVGLVTRYLPLVHAAALRRLGGDEHRAREVTQMVFTELAQKAAKLVHHPTLAAWLHQSTRWHASNFLRSERRRAHHEHAAADHLATVDAPEPGADWNTLRPVLDDALDTLRETDREAVLQRFVMDRPFAAIGEKLGVSENAARMRVDRALDTLRAALARHGITSTSAALALVLTQHAGATTPVSVSSAAIASTACQAAAGAAVAGATGALLPKILLGISASAAAALSVALWNQDAENARLERELADLHAKTREVSTLRPAIGAVAAAATTTTPAVDSRVIRQIEDDIIAAAELAVPLNADQQERVRLDTLIRKGELDGTHAMLFRQLRLPPQHLDALKTLLVERNQAIYDAGQVAKEEGLLFASYAETEDVNRVAVEEIDRRIAATLGAGTLAALQEYEALAPFRLLGDMAAPPGDANHAAYDAAALSLARALKQAAPEYPEVAFQSNGWPFDTPPAMLEVIVRTLGAEAGEMFARRFEVRPMNYKLAAYVRDAVLAGKLPPSSLSGSIAREYETAVAAQRAEAKP